LLPSSRFKNKQSIENNKKQAASRAVPYPGTWTEQRRKNNDKPNQDSMSQTGILSHDLQNAEQE
jgi:hypothetical protein